MKKNLILPIFTFLIVVFPLNIKAMENEIYYTNSYNVNFTKNQYDYFTEMFYEGYQNTITQKEFNLYSIDVMDPSLVETKYMNTIQPYGTIISSSSKTLKISTSGTTKKYVSVVATWKNNPIVRSNDLIGCYLYGVSLNGTVTTKLTYSGGGYFSNEIKSFNNGFGVSIQLPSSGSNIIISQSFTTTTGGIIYASYQHAKSNISLTNSKKYTIGHTGYGNVFILDNSIKDYYDGMSGVNISV